MTKEIKLDKKALEWACKQLMINSAKNDKVIKESTSLSEHVKFISWINELSYIQTLMLFFDNKYIKVNEQHVAEPQIRQKESKIKTALKYGLAGVAGGMVNNGTGLAAMLVYYFYRRSNDVCHNQCKTSADSKKCQYICRVTAANQVLNNIKSEIGKCNKMSKPDKCRNNLQKMANKWNKILMHNKAKLDQL